MFGFKSKRVKQLEEEVEILKRDVSKLFDRNRVIAMGPYSRFAPRHRQWVGNDEAIKLIMRHLKIELRNEPPRGGGVKLVTTDDLKDEQDYIHFRIRGLR